MKANLQRIPMRRWALLGLFILFLGPVDFSEAGVKERVQETVLPNGLKVILLEDHRAPVVSFQVWYRVGSRNEVWGKTGLSHMLEHMMFKGTEKVSGGEFARIIQENGGNFNAFTSKDFTGYFENLSADRFQKAVDLESDRMQNLQLREEDFRTERMVVMEERRMRTEDNPQDFMIEQLEATAYQLQPYHWPTIGWGEDIARFTLADLKAYYQTYYNPANAFLVVVGDFKREELLPRIEAAFGEIPKGIAPDQTRDVDPPQKGERRIEVKKEAQLPLVVMAYHVPNLRDPDSYVLEVIASLLSEGKSSILYRNLVREKKLALGAEASYPLLSRDPNLFMVSAEALPGVDISVLEKALTQELDRIGREPVPDSELQKAKNQLEASFVFAQESVFSQAVLLAHYEIASDWRALDEYLPAIRKVTAEDILRVAKKYLTSENRTVGILRPLAPTGAKPAPSGFSLKTKTVR